jgi:hypothetical protein
VELDEMLKETYKKPEIPIYNFTRNMSTGKVNMNVKKTHDNEITHIMETNNGPVKIEVKQTNANKEKAAIMSFIEKADHDILNKIIEIKIHQQLILMETDTNQKIAHETRLRVLASDLDYLKKRKTALEKIL